MGEDGQLCVVLLGWAALLSWHSIVSGWWSSRPQRCKDACGGSESCGEDCIRLCVLCTQSALGRTGFRRHRRRDRRALLSMWGTRTSEGTGGPEHKIEDRQLCGEWRSRGKQRVITASTLHLLLGHCNCLLLGCLWAQHLFYL